MRKSLWIFLLTGLIGFLASSPAMALSVGFTPTAQTVPQGSSLSVDVVATPAPGSGEIVSAYDLDLSYDASIITATGVTFGTALGGPLDSLTDSILSSGLVNFAEVSFLSDADLASLQTSPFTLASISFTADAVGTSPLSFINYSTLTGKDIKGALVTAYTSPNLGSGSVTVTGAAVPEPGTLVLLVVFGLATLLVCRKKVKAIL